MDLQASTLSTWTLDSLCPLARVFVFLLGFWPCGHAGPHTSQLQLVTLVLIHYRSNFLFLWDPQILASVFLPLLPTACSQQCSCCSFLPRACGRLGLPCDRLSPVVLNLPSFTLLSLSRLWGLVFSRRERLYNSTVHSHKPPSLLKIMLMLPFVRYLVESNILGSNT